MDLTVVNLQRSLPVETKLFREFVQSLSASVREAAERPFSVAFVSDRRMKELNSFFRGKDSTTDVLSFPHEPDEFERALSPGFSRQPPEGGTQNAATQNGETQNYLGDIVISVEQAQKQAEENGLTLEAEIKQLILHGLLHLCGYDHETDSGEMNARELELRDKLGL